MGQAGQPLIAFPLIDPEFRLQRRGKFRFEILGIADFLNLLLPSRVGTGMGKVGNFFQLQGRQRVDQHLVAAVFGQSFRKEVDILQPFLELLGQGNELSVANLHEAAWRFLDLGQQFFQFDNLALIEGELAAHGKPVLAIGPNLQVEVFQRHFVGDGQFFPFWPLYHHFVANCLELHQGLETIVGVVEMPFPVVFLLHVDCQIEYRTELFDVSGLFFLKRQIAPGLESFAIDFGHDVFNALAGFKVVTAFQKRFDEHFQSKSRTIGDEMHING